MFQSTHNLEFLSREWHPLGVVGFLDGDGWQEFKIGTCCGQWRAVNGAYEILSVINETPGNGHLQDVFDWFENSCKRDKRDLVILEVWNEKFLKHLIEKRGFEQIPMTLNVKKSLAFEPTSF